MSTRDYDIGRIEEDKSAGVISEERAKKLISNLHRQAKDEVLEKMRQEMIDAGRRGDLVKVEMIGRKIREHARKKGYE